MPQTNLADVTKFRVKTNVTVESPTTIRLDVVSPGTVTDQWYLPAAIGQTVLFRAQAKTTAAGAGQGVRITIDIYNATGTWIRNVQGAYVPWGTTNYVQAPECSTVFQAGDSFCDIVLEAIGETAGSSAWFTSLEFYVLNPGESPPGGGTPPPVTPPTYGTRNLGHIPEGWWVNPYHPGTAAYAVEDNSTYYANPPSVELTGPTAENDRNTESLWWPVVAGQRVVARAWIKIDSIPGFVFNPADPATWRGARIGIDFYGANGYIGGVSGPHGTIPQSFADTLANWVPWNTPGWNFRQIDMIIPATFPSDATGQPVAVTQVVMWVEVLPGTDAGNAWFSDMQLFILDPGVSPPDPIQAVQYVLDIWAMNGGTTNPTGTQTVNSGTQVSITATPNQGYTFTGWLVNNQPASANPLTLTITGPTTVIPQFQTIPTFTLTIIASVGGKTDPQAGAVSVKAGTDTVVKASADQGYVFDHWLFDGQDQTPWFPTSTFTLWNAQANHTLQAVFTVASQVPTMAGSSTAFLLVLGGITVGGLVIGLTRGKKRTQRRRK